MFDKIDSSYQDSLKLLRRRGVLVSAATDDYVTKAAGNLIPNLVSEKDTDLLRSIFLLRGADVCMTRHIDRPVISGVFGRPVLVEVRDIQIAEFTSACHCLRRRKCHVPKNHVAYLATFSGEAERLRFMKSEIATDFGKLQSGEALAARLIEAYGELPENMRWLLEMKCDIWVALSKLIGLSGTMSELRLPKDFE